MAILTRTACYAAGMDAGNRSMRAAGRTSWNASDFAAAAQVTNRLLFAAGLVCGVADDR